MKSQTYSGDEERAVLTGLIVNDRILSKVLSGLGIDKKPFRAKWSNIIFKWCSDFYQNFGKAPRKNIQTLFGEFAAKEKDDNIVNLIERLLTSLDDDFKKVSKDLNEDYIVDLANRYFTRIRLERLKDSIEASLLRDDLDSAKEFIASYSPVSFASDDVIDVFTDKEAWDDAITEKEDDVLIRYPGALGEFFGTHLQRDAFVSFLAPEKRGKSWWLIDMAWRASTMEKRNTLFWSCGDMSKRQVLKRLVTRAAMRPIHACEIRRPTSITRKPEEDPVVSYDYFEYDTSLSKQECDELRDALLIKTASKDSLLKLKCTSNASTSVADIRNFLDECIKDGWIPDVLVIDYADILRPCEGTEHMEYRHQQNIIWQQLRKLSSDYHILLITATQADAMSYDGKLLTMKNFSEDKRKYGHVTAMCGLNQTSEEKKKGIYRTNWIALREGESHVAEVCHVAGCLGIASPTMRSVW